MLEFDHLLLVTSVLVALALILYLFYFNRFLAFCISQLIRLWSWNQGQTSLWVGIGSIHFSLLAGRVLVRDFCYHSSNQTVQIVKCQISWRYWIRRPMQEEDLSQAKALDDDVDGAHKQSLPCRVQVTIEGLEWHMYNRTMGYDAILDKLGVKSRTEDRGPAGPVATPARTVSRQDTPIYPPSSAAAGSLRRIPGFLASALSWASQQLPQLDPKDLLPVGLELTRAAIVCGNPSTPNLLLTEFQTASGIIGVVPATSKCDLYKQTVELSLQDVSLQMVENTGYLGSMAVIGDRIADKVNRDRRSRYPWPKFMTYAAFASLWRRLNLRSIVMPHRSRRGAAVSSLRGRFSAKRRAEPENQTPVGTKIDFSKVEYAIERKILDAPRLDLVYYVDAVGKVPDPDSRPPAGPRGSTHQPDIGNGDLPPDWGVDVVIHDGFMRYGPWADRQRSDLQRAFFPPTYVDAEPTPRLEVGDQRVWTALKVFVELRGGTTLFIPFREPSKNWQWDGVSYPPRQRTRDAASIHIKAGDRSTISYVMPMVADSSGYQPRLDVHLDSVAVTSSLNDIRLLQADTWRITCQLPAPLRWRAEREWIFDLSFERPVLFLLRDHINMLADVGKDWSTGPPSDFQRFVPMLYTVRFNLRDYEINTYNNDLNIIDKPSIREDNAYMTLRGQTMRGNVQVDSTTFRPRFSIVPISMEAPDLSLGLSLPKWNTHWADSQHGSTDLIRVALLRLDAKYLYHADVRPEHVEQLHLTFTAREVAFRAFGWAIRHFMVLRDNYFGSFTHFSTLREYLRKQRENIPVGDPIELQYRPGKSNAFQVQLQLEVESGYMMVPTALIGFDRFDPQSSRRDLSHSPYVTLVVPSLQVQLRSHDYFMEMSLDIETVVGCLQDAGFNEFLVPKTLPTRDSVVIDGLDITAYRLFGPQPRTSTYCCIWDINIENIRASMSASQAVLFSAALSAFRLGFSDPLNAPASCFALPVDPDVTFVRFGLASADLVWHTAEAIAQVAIPQRITFQSNDIAGKHYKKMSSIRVPDASIKLLSPSANRRIWLEAASFGFGLTADLYSAPAGWQQAANAQTLFVTEQDRLTQRLADLTSKFVAHEALKPAKGQPLNRRLRVRSLRVAVPRAEAHDQEENNPAALGLQTFSRQSTPTDSDGEHNVPDADRDARLAQSRLLAPLVSTRLSVDGESTCTGEESDATDDGSDYTWSDWSEVENMHTTPLSKYLKYTKHYTTRLVHPPSLWNGPSIIAIKDNPLAAYPAPHAETTNPSSVDKSILTGGQMADRNCDMSAWRIAVGSVVFSGTPLMLPVIRSLLDDTRQNTDAEITLNMLVMDYVGSYGDKSSPNRQLNLDLSLDHLHVRLAQRVTILSQDQETRHSLVDNYFPEVEEQLTISYCTFKGFRLLQSSQWLNDVALQPRLSVRLGELIGSLVTLPPELLLSHRSLRKGGCDVMTWSLSSITASLVSGLLAAGVEGVDIDVRHSAAEFTMATAHQAAEWMTELSRLLQDTSEGRKAFAQNLILAVLDHAQSRKPADPFSAIQPSYLVQTGLPHDLRGDVQLRILAHIRNCLRLYDHPERLNLIEDIIHKQAVSLQQIVDLLQPQLPQFLPDAEGVISSEMPVLQDLFRQASQNPDQRDSASFPLSSITFSLTKIRLRLRDPDKEAHCTWDLGPMKLKGQLRTSNLMPIFAVEADKSTQDVSSTARTPETRRVAAIISLGSSVLEVYPHLLAFVPQLWRLHRLYTKTQVSQRKRRKSLSPRPDLVHGRRPWHIQLSMSTHDFIVRAAAANLVAEVTAQHLSASSAVLYHKPDRGGSIDIAMVHSLLLRKLSLSAQSHSDRPDQQGRDTLASITVTDTKTTASMHRWPLASANTRLTIGLKSIQFAVPRSALRLYRFVSAWRADYLPPLQRLLDDMMTEIRGTSATGTRQPNTTEKLPFSPDIQVHFTLDSLRVSLQIMLGTWLTWEAQETVAFWFSPSKSRRAMAHTFGIQTVRQVITVASKRDLPKEVDPTTRVKLDIPTISALGRKDRKGLYAITEMEKFHVTIKPSHWDTVLSVQQKFGNDFNDLISLIEQSRQSEAPPQTPPISTPNRRNPLNYIIFAKLRGFRIGLDGRYSTVYLECEDVGGGINSEGGRAVNLRFRGLALSLAPGRRIPGSQASFDRDRRSAFLVLDLEFDVGDGGLSQLSAPALFKLAIPRIHAVMQPASIGELGDFVEHLQSEILMRRHKRAAELAQFKEKTRSILRTFDAKVKETPAAKTGWLDRYMVSFAARNIGIAFPLSLDVNVQGVQSPKAPGSSVALRAFLFSIKSLTFGSHQSESGQASMKGFALQFVPRFRQSVASHFSGDSHSGLHNCLTYPETTVQIRSHIIESSRTIQARADVSGFSVDIDPSLPDYVFSLVDVYREGKTRMARVAANVSRDFTPSAKLAPPIATRNEEYDAVRLSTVSAFFSFRSGEVRLYPITVSGESDRSKNRRSAAILALSTAEAEVFRLPEVSVWAEYRASNARKPAASEVTVETPTLLFKSTVHSSRNVLRPALLPFLADFSKAVESRMRRQSVPEPEQELLPAQSQGATIPAGIAGSSLQTTFSLRIDKSELELTCQPDVNVVAGLNWESGGFAITVFPGARRATFTGSVGGLTIGLRHGFLSEDCLKLHAHDLAFSTSYERTSEGANLVSLVVDTEFAGSAKFSRLQDVLCFKAVWLDRIPIFTSAPASEMMATPSRGNVSLPAVPVTSEGQFTTVILVRVRRVDVVVDLGQSISIMHLDLRDLGVRTHLNHSSSEISVSIAQLGIAATGNISGTAEVPDFVFQTIRNRQHRERRADKGDRMLELAMTSGPLVISIESEHQKLLQYRAEPLKVLIHDDWSHLAAQIPQDDHRLFLSFVIVGTEIDAAITVSTLPRLLAYVEKFKSNLEAQRQGASRESEAFRVARQPKPDNPLSSVANAMLQNARNSLKDTDKGLSYVVLQRMSLQLTGLRLAVFPRTFGDHEMAQLVGHGIYGELERDISSDGRALERSLRLAFSSLAISKLSHLAATTHVSGVPVHNAPASTIFALPAMRMRMLTEEQQREQAVAVVYDFWSRFVREPERTEEEDIFISLNVSLYSWLTVLRKSFSREMDEVRSTKQFGAIVPQTTTAVRSRKYPELLTTSIRASMSPRSPTEQPSPVQSLPPVDAIKGRSAILPSPLSRAGASTSGPQAVDRQHQSPTASSPDALSPLSSPSMTSVPAPAPQPESGTPADADKQTTSGRALIYEPRTRHIERLTMRQLGEATPDVMHPFFMKKAGFSVEDSLPQYVHEYAAVPLESIMEILLGLYGRQLRAGGGAPMPETEQETDE